MKPLAYYNEFDKQKAAWLRELIARNLIAPGDVDERSIADVRPADLRGYRQCHFFAGVGAWSYALRLAGWSDDREVWTGSCPCPSFSAAGKGEGFDDPRHLWPVWMPLISECGPPVVFGEQADAAIGHGWLDLVSTDLEASAYAVGAAVLGACSVGAPHRRQRLYFVADTELPASPRQRQHGGEGLSNQESEGLAGNSRSGELEYPESIGRIGRSDDTDGGRGERASGSGDAACLVADATNARRDDAREYGSGRAQLPARSFECGATGDVADTDGGFPGDGRIQRGWQHGLLTQDSGTGDGDRRTGPVNGFWRDADWIFCRDRKWRPTRPGSFPLAHGAPARMVRLRGYGDAINAQVAAAFIGAYMESERAHRTPKQRGSDDE